MTKKFIYSILIFIIIIFHFNFAEATDIFYPYPIIFVHGINSNITTWNYTKGELEKYFKDQSGYKYPFQDSEYDYFPLCDYRGQNKGDISNIAITSLKYFIGLALDSFPPEVPESERKVILVCHSMGGLVVRSLLKQDLSGYYASKIDRVIFLGTPHLGSSWASSVWLLNKIRQEIMNPVVKDYTTFYAQNVGSRFTFSDASSSVQITGLPSQIYNNLTHWLGIEKGRLDKALFLPDIMGFSGSKAVEQLRLNQDVTFKKTIEYLLGYNLAEVELKGSIRGGETFLGKAAENLANPRNFKVIRGQNPFPFPLLEKIGDWGISCIYTSYDDDFTFPPYLSLDDAINTGDGIVPQLSQEGIKGLGSADYTVNAFHFDIPPILIVNREEVEQYDTILQAIDDAPVIEDVNLSFSTKACIIRIKVKDYLLADIEIAEMTVNDYPLDLSEFRDPLTGKYKPYFKYPNKEFLKERNDAKTGTHLMPGEFEVNINKDILLNNNRKIYIKLKNPAQKQASCAVYLPNDSRTIRREGSALNYYDGRISGPGWERTKQAAYDNMLNAPVSVSVPPQGSTYVIGASVGIEGWAKYEWTYYDEYGHPLGQDFIPNAGIRMTYKGWRKFELDIGTKKIKSVKFKARLSKNVYYDYPNGYPKPRTTIDFNVLAYCDTSNIWPPPLNLEYDADQFLFSLNTVCASQPPDYSKEVEVELNPRHITLNGNNVWEFKPDFSEYNCIPDFNIRPDGSFSNAGYEQAVNISFPLLFVTFEENNP